MQQGKAHFVMTMATMVTIKEQALSMIVESVAVYTAVSVDCVMVGIAQVVY